ncbi:MAG: type IV pilin N-terminal domain-containing protein [Methanoregula sp.]|nr:type IV pilin N-terminal domain-containing protein [Methanoregula sp.]
MTKNHNDSAVSPVIGVMLMLVVVIIIAAIVSAYGGGITSGQSKAPQAQVKGMFSITDGMTITNAGGDSLATKDLVFTIRDGPTFGTDLESSTAQTVNMSTIQVSAVLSRTGEAGPMRTLDGAFYMVSFNPGDTVTIKPADCTCNFLQPGIAPTDFKNNVRSDGYTYETDPAINTDGVETAAWALCIRNQNSIGKSFILEVSDTAGHSISKSDVVITA